MGAADERDGEGGEEADRSVYRLIVETAPTGLTTIDEDGTITWANRVFADTLGMAPEELVGTHFTDLIDAGYFDQEVVDEWLDAVRDLLSSSTGADRRSFLVRTNPPDGETLVHDVHTALLPLEDGEFTGTVHAFRDITAQKAYERELERQNERLEAFTEVVSHDLRNPLNVAQGNLQLALETGDREPLETALGAHERMESLVEDLLALARDGRAVDDPRPVEVAAVARRAWQSVDTGAAALEVADGVGVHEADPDRLQQLFENLFRNGVEHGSEDGDGAGLTVSVGPLEAGRGIYVADDGLGIPPQVRERAFERSFSTRRDGTGFGLAIVESIAEAHGWTVEAVAADGARFEVRTDGGHLPADDGSVSAEAE